jgi:MFS family permease
LAHFTHHLLTALPQPMLPYIQQEFNLNMTKSAIVTSSFSLPAAAAQLPSGWLADRIGPTVLITIGIVGVAIGGFLVGISQTYLMLVIFLALMGLASGGYHPASTPLISMSVPLNQRGRALGFHLIGGNSSFFLAPIVAAGIASASSFGWRGSFVFLAIPVAVLGIMFFVYLNRRYGRAHVEAMKRQQMQDHPIQPGYKRRLIAFLVMMFIGGGASASVNTFLPLYITRGLGASNAVGAMSLSIIFSSGLWAGPVGGYLADRFGSVKVIIATGLVSAIVIFLLKSVELGFGLWLVLWVMGLNMALRFPVTEVFIMSQAPAKHRSTIYGIYYSTMQYTGSIFALIMGPIIDHLNGVYGGYEAAFKMMFNYSAWAVAAVAVITALFIWDAKD